MARRPQKPRLDVDAELRRLDADTALSTLRSALKQDHYRILARAAELAAERLCYELEADLIAAFRRLITTDHKRDPGCLGKGAIARALVALDCLDATFYREGITLRQPEPVWGGAVDTAADVRASCAMGLAASGDPRALIALVDLLADPEHAARGGAARAIACTEPLAAEAVLRTKVLLGDDEPDVIGECLRGLLDLEPDASPAFVARLLNDANPELAAAGRPRPRRVAAGRRGGAAAHPMGTAATEAPPRPCPAASSHPRPQRLRLRLVVAVDPRGGHRHGEVPDRGTGRLPRQSTPRRTPGRANRQPRRARVAARLRNALARTVTRRRTPHCRVTLQPIRHRPDRQGLRPQLQQPVPQSSSTHCPRQRHAIQRQPIERRRSPGRSIVAALVLLSLAWMGQSASPAQAAAANDDASANTSAHREPTLRITEQQQPYKLGTALSILEDPSGELGPRRRALASAR